MQKGPSLSGPTTLRIAQEAVAEFIDVGAMVEQTCHHSVMVRRISFHGCVKGTVSKRKGSSMGQEEIDYLEHSVKSSVSESQDVVCDGSMG
jgi:hypothetical protein